METTHLVGGRGQGLVVDVMEPKEVHVHPMRTHPEHSVVFIERGWVELDVGICMRIEAGSFMVLPAGTPHKPVRAENVRAWFVGFCAGCLGLEESLAVMAPLARVRRGAVPVVRCPPERHLRVLDTFAAMRRESEGRDRVSLELAKAHLTVLLGELCRALPALGTGDKPSLVSETLAYIEKHALEGIGPRDVATALCRSPGHLTTVVRKATGQSVGDWIRAARVAEAARRLSHTDESLAEIAEQVGWADVTHFIRQFRKTYGKTPAAWRRAQRVRAG